MLIPRCIGGANEPENIVVLTAEEHYVAHQLLAKIYPDVKGLVYAVVAMTGRGRGVSHKNKLYVWIRKSNLLQCVEPYLLGRAKFTPEQLKKISNGCRGKKAH